MVINLQHLGKLFILSNDPHSNMLSALRRQLQANNVSIVDNQNNVTVLRLNSTKNTEQVAQFLKRK